MPTEDALAGKVALITGASRGIGFAIARRLGKIGAREAQDRRVVKTRITAEGLRLLRELDQPVDELHRRELRHLSAKHLRQLLTLLERARERLSGAISGPELRHRRKSTAKILDSPGMP